MPIAEYFMKTKISYYYTEIKRLRNLSKEDLTKWQIIKLKELLWHAYLHTKYYKEVFANAEITPEDINSISDLNKLPILTKSDIRNNFENLIPDNINEIPFIRASTGGSTGNPMVFLLDKKSWSFSNANYALNWELAGYVYGDKYIALGSTSLLINKKPSFKHFIYYLIKNKVSLNGINMSDRICQSYLELIIRENISFIYGYASSIYVLACYALKENIEVNIKGCFPTSEVLTDIYRETILKAFKCKIINSYGANDGGVTAFEHEVGFFEVSYNTIINKCKTNSNNEIVSASITDLLNYAMPLINYQLGDEYKIDDVVNEACVFNGQIINSIIGRTSDIIHMENGKVLTGPGFTILFKDLPVEYYCIEKKGVNKINVAIKKLDGYNEQHEKIIMSSLNKQLGIDTQVSINYTDEIKLSPNGKRIYFTV